MPELRKGVCRGRATVAQQQQPRQEQKQTRQRNQGRKRAAAEGGRPRTRLAVKRLKEEDHRQVVVATTAREDHNQNHQLIVISERDSDILRKELEKVDKEKKGAVMGDDSGGLSANKAAGQEEEGSTAPFPERVCLWFCLVLFFFFLCFLNCVYFIIESIVVLLHLLVGSCFCYGFKRLYFQ